MSGGEACARPNQAAAWIIGELATAGGSVPVISTRLSAKDRLGAWKVRWGIGRMNYKVTPGLYAVGQPGDSSPVLVSANYKLSFDSLRKELTGLDCWLLVLDTKGINVWCAAGKGTFGATELLRRLAACRLPKLVTHKTLILPQLAAPGVSAPEVARRSGFSVVYGPVRAHDIPDFLTAGLVATTKMRQVRFTAWDRLALTPMELVPAAKVSLSVFGLLFLLNLFAARPFGAADALAYLGAVLAGTVLTPLLLPLLPGHSFAAKGWLAGFFTTAAIAWFSGWFQAGQWLLAAGYLLALPAYSAFLALNFTGSSTYTSFSGVIKEMKLSLPPIVVALVIGVILLLIKTFGG